MLIKILLILVLVLTILVPVGAYFISGKGRKSYKRTLAVNIITFFGILIVSQIVIFTDSVSAAEVVAGAPTIGAGLGYIAAALSTSASCIGAGIAVASSASSALGAISEDQSIFGKSLVFVGLSEGIALYGMIISFMILGKL